MRNKYPRLYITYKIKKLEHSVLFVYLFLFLNEKRWCIQLKKANKLLVAQLNGQKKTTQQQQNDPAATSAIGSQQSTIKQLLAIQSQLKGNVDILIPHSITHCNVQIIN